MGLLTLAAVAALADPVVLRGVERGDGVGIAVGSRSLSVGWRRRGLDLAADLGWDGLAAGVSAGVSDVLLGRRWRVDGGVSGGLVAVPYARTVALAATPWIGAGRVGGRGALELRLASPMVVGTGGARFPASAELIGGVCVERVWITPRAAFAPIWTPGLDVSVAAELGLVVTAALPRHGVR